MLLAVWIRIADRAGGGLHRIYDERDFAILDHIDDVRTPFATLLTGRYRGRSGDRRSRSAVAMSVNRAGAAIAQFHGTRLSGITNAQTTLPEDGSARRRHLRFEQSPANVWPTPILLPSTSFRAQYRVGARNLMNGNTASFTE